MVDNKYDVRVINLKSRPERWEHFSEVSPFTNYSRFNAVDGRNLSNENRIVKIKLKSIEGQDRVLGEIGCTLSHYMLWRYVREQKNPVLILEDDVIFHDDSIQTLTEAYEELCSGNLKDADWVLAWVGGQWTPKYGIKSVCKFPFHYSKDVDPWYTKISNSLYMRHSVGRAGWRSPTYRTTSGYFISPAGAGLLIKLADRDPNFFNIAIDIWMLRIEAMYLPVRYMDVFPHPIYQGSYNIGEGDWSAVATGPDINNDERLQNSDVLRGKSEKITL
jgi:GR25 family glycosyltransferase involved in LPS biosynthesis